MVDRKLGNQRVAKRGSGRIYRRLNYLAVALALVAAVVVGVYVRLSDVGFGCPDWPASSGHMAVGGAEAHASQINARSSNRPLESAKMTKETVHRYATGTLGLLVLMLLILGWWRKRHQTLLTILAGLTLFQALLGMWTVTMKLKPWVVTGHLIGGMTVLALLWWVLLANRHRRQTKAGAASSSSVTAGIRIFAGAGLVLLAAQIFHSGWTSINDAGLACNGFPTCSGQWWPHADYSTGRGSNVMDGADLGEIAFFSGSR